MTDINDPSPLSWMFYYRRRWECGLSLGDMPPTHKPTQRCAWLTVMDAKHNTPTNSPMHHNARCVKETCK